MSKATLTDAVAEALGSTKVEAGKAIDAVVTALSTVVGGGVAVTLPPLGRFSLKHKAARQARNLHTGEPIHVAAKDVVVFKSSRKP